MKARNPRLLGTGCKTRIEEDMNRLCCCLFLALVTPIVSAQNRVRYDDRVVVRTEIDDLRELRTMLAIGGQLWSESMGVGTIDFMIPDDRIEALKRTGIDFEILVPDVQSVIDDELARIEAAQGGIAGGGFFSEYQERESLIDFYDALASARPDLVTSRIIGTSTEGRPIPAYTICGSDAANRPGLYVVTGAHSREWIAPATIAYLADALVNRYGIDSRITDLVDGLAWHIVPMANPDGYEHSWNVDRLWRKTRSVNGDGTFGVDWNRNFAAGWGGPGSSGNTSSDIYRGTKAFSEPETRAIRDDVTSTPNVAMFFDVHCYSQLVLWPYGYNDTEPEGLPGEIHRAIGQGIADQIASVNGAVFDPIPAHGLYLASGTSLDWAWDDASVYSFTYELRDTGQFGFILPPDQIIPSGQEILESFLWTGEQLMGSAVAEFVDPLPNSAPPSSVIDVRARLEAIFSTLDLTTADLVVDRSGSPTQRIGMNLEADGSLTASFDSGVCGSTVSISFEVESTDGVLIAITEPSTNAWSIDVVDQSILFEDDVESDLGWTLGLPSDDATTGVWVRVDPNGTGAQPEDDASDPGSICFVTGQGSVGGSLGENDIDGGRTTLVSPTITLGGQISTVTLDFALWYSNDTGASPNADTMLVEAKFDDEPWNEILVISQSASEWRQTRVNVETGGKADSVQFRFVASDLGDGSVVEAGIDEVRVLAVSCTDAFCPADFNQDGVVNGVDLGLLLADWGTNPGSPADLDGNGEVGGSDIGLLLASWGICS